MEMEIPAEGVYSCDVWKGGRNMLSIKMVQLVETHWEQISTRILHKIRNDARLAHVGKLSESELRERTREIGRASCRERV